MKKYLSAFIIYLILILVDGGLTFYNTPDLSREGNPLVVYFNFGWGALITINLIVICAIFFACHFTFNKYETVIVDVPNTRAYISQLFYNRPDKFVWTFYKLPKNWKPFWACVCYIVYFAGCAAAVIRDLEWLAVTFNFNMNIYDGFRNEYFFGRFDIAVGLVVALVSSFVWLKNEYKKSKKLITDYSKN